MKRRGYSMEIRQAAAGLTRSRIVEAAVALHAERGPSATAHADIAVKAGVSLPTVYKYFPAPADVVPACTGHVLERSPVRLEPAMFEGKKRLPLRLAALADAAFTLHEYLAPWLRWPMDLAAFPALGEVFRSLDERTRKVIREAFRPAFPKGPPAEIMDLSMTLLGFPSWRALTSAGRSTRDAARVAATALERYTRGFGRQGGIR